MALISTLQNSKIFLKSFSLSGKLDEARWRIVLDAIKNGWQVKKLKLSVADVPDLATTMKDLAKKANSRSLCELVVNYRNIVEFPKVFVIILCFLFFSFLFFLKIEASIRQADIATVRFLSMVRNLSSDPCILRVLPSELLYYIAKGSCYFLLLCFSEQMLSLK